MSNQDNFTFNYEAPESYFITVVASTSQTNYSAADYPAGAAPALSAIWHKGDAMGIMDGTLAVSNNTAGNVTYYLYRTYVGPVGTLPDLRGGGSNSGTGYIELKDFGNTGLIHEHLYAVPIK